jgi:hypothetical protein
MLLKLMTVVVRVKGGIGRSSTRKNPYSMALIKQARHVVQHEGLRSRRKPSGHNGDV